MYYIHLRSVTLLTDTSTNKIYREKSIPLCGVQHSVIMADFIMPETQQPIIVIILTIYLLNDNVEYISGIIGDNYT